MEGQGQGDVLRGREAGDEIIRLEDETDRGPPVDGPLLPAHGRQVAVVDPHAAGIRRVQAAQQVQQRRLPRAADAEDRHELPLLDVQIHIGQGPNFRRADAVVPRQAAGFDKGRSCLQDWGGQEDGKKT